MASGDTLSEGGRLTRFERIRDAPTGVSDLLHLLDARGDRCQFVLLERRWLLGRHRERR